MQKTNVIKSMREEEKAKNELIIAISIIVLLLFLTLVFHWRMLRIKNKSNVQLENRNKLINKQKDEISKIANVLSNTNNELKDKNLELTKLLEERKFIQEQLIQSKKMASIGILTAGIAHEINNPVNFIQGGINSLLRDFKDVEKVISEGEKIYSETGDLKEKLLRFKKLRNEYSFKEALESIPEILQDIKLGADRTAQIVKSLSAFARSDDGNYHWLNIHKSIEDSLELLRNKYKENIGIIKQFDGNIPEIRCNPTKINQIFMNLLSNAIDAISGNGKITITTKLLADKISISIKDTGHGISKELQSKIFDPFYTSKPVGKGTGMGLFIVYGLIQENHGSIDLISEPGVGSEFIIKIPIT